MASEILSFAGSHGITLIDTAADYGNAEAVIGAGMLESAEFAIVTKIGGLRSESDSPADIALVERTLTRSLARLRCDSVYGLLVHVAGDLIAPDGTEIWAELLRLQDAGMVTKVGVSVYDAAELDGVLARFPVELVQLPLNVLDQRLLVSGHIRDLVSRGVEIHARSIFLQGVLLLPPSRLPANFTNYRSALEKYHAILRENGLSPIEAALAFVREQQEIAYALVGVTTTSELSEIVNAAAAELQPALDFSAFRLSDEHLLDPSQWDVVA